MRNHIALALADAMLSGKATPASARARCAKALGSNVPWLLPLCRFIVRKHDLSWRPGERREVAKSIAEHSSFASAWHNGKQPVIRFYFLAQQELGPRPINLEHCALPDLPAVGDIAHWLGLEIRQLDWYADIRGRNADEANERLRHYRFRWIPKRSSGHRLLEVPKIRLKGMQRKILDELLAYVPPHAAAHGFRARHSCVTNATPHVGQQIVIRLDLQDFFVSIGAARVEGVFRMLGYPENASRVLAGLCTTRAPAFVVRPADLVGYEFELPQLDWLARKRLQSPHLPQGAPTSPALANLCAFNMDLRLHSAAESMGACYTRYADDLTFSGGDELARASDRFIELVTRIIQEEGYALNFRKTRVMRKGSRQQVTGIVVNEKTNIARSDRDALKATLYNCVRFGPATQNRKSLPDFRAHLEGRVAQLAAIDASRGARMRALLGRIAW
jgi:hypothetical protein